jgi:hypothetical protein
MYFNSSYIVGKFIFIGSEKYWIGNSPTIISLHPSMYRVRTKEDIFIFVGNNDLNIWGVIFVTVQKVPMFVFSMINNVVVVLECDLMILASRWDTTSCPSDLTVIKKSIGFKPVERFSPRVFKKGWFYICLRQRTWFLHISALLFNLDIRKVIDSVRWDTTRKTTSRNIGSSDAPC